MGPKPLPYITKSPIVIVMKTTIFRFSTSSKEREKRGISLVYAGVSYKFIGLWGITGAFQSREQSCTAS
jgi:hypothetical protein